MVTIKNYVKVQSLEEAWELNQKRNNRIIGGMLWIKMGSNTIQNAIDLSGLGLDTIEEEEEQFSIGCMVTLRQLELHPGLQEYTGGALREALRHIVGVQFRNLATVGGSIYGRYGFSDVLTMFLSLDTQVELYKGGVICLKDYAREKYDNDILVRLIVKKTPVHCKYQSVRNSKTDFPVLTCAASVLNGKLQLAIGARPGRARLYTDTGNMLGKPLTEQQMEAFAEWLEKEVPTQGNMRGSAAYRSHLVKVLVRRALNELGGYL